MSRAKIQMLAGNNFNQDHSEIQMEADDINIVSDNMDFSAVEKLGSWVNMTVSSSYAEVQPLQRKKIGDMIYMRGSVRDVNSNFSNGVVMVTLPTGWRPAHDTHYRLRLGADHINVLIRTNGDIEPQETKASSSNVMFHGVVFSTSL